MPRIPTSKPQDVRAKPSIGGQININSQDSFFRSIASASAEAGQLVEQARVEKQKAIDVKEENQVKIYQVERAAELKTMLNDADISEHSGIIDDFAAQNKKLEFAPGVSRTAREALQQGNDLWTQKLYSNSMSWSAEKAEKDKMATGEQVVANSINAMDVDGAIAGIRSLGLSPELQQARVNEALATIKKKQEDNIKANLIESNGTIKDSMDVAYEAGLPENLDLIKADARNKGVWNDELEADYLQYKKGSEKQKFDQGSKTFVSAISLLISKTQTLDQIESNKSEIEGYVKSGNITRAQANAELESNEAKRRSLITEETTKLRSDLSFLSNFKTQAQQGLLDEPQLEQYRSILGEDTYQALTNINKGELGSKGTDSEEYVDAQKQLEEFISQGSFLGIHWDADKEDLEGINNLITSEDFTQNAKLKLMSTYLAALYKDATKDDILVFASGGESDVTKEFKAKEIHRDFAKHIATKLFDKTAAPRAIIVDGDSLSKEETIDVAKGASVKASLINAEDAYDLLSRFWTQQFFGSLTDENYQEKVDGFNDILKEKTRNSSTKIIQNQFLEYRGKISKFYSER
jgi:hypothetical protein